MVLIHPCDEMKGLQCALLGAGTSVHLKDKEDGVPALGGGRYIRPPGLGAGREDDGWDKHYAVGRLGAQQRDIRLWWEFRDVRGSTS